MTKTTYQWITTAIANISNYALRRWVLLGLVGLAVAASYVHASFPSGNAKKVSMHPSQEAAIAVEANYMMDRLDAVFASSTPWEDQAARDKWMASLKKLADSREMLAVTFGPVEIPQDETPETATRVALPLPSATWRTRATGKVMENHRIPDTNDNGAWGVFEKRGTSEGQKWYAMDFSPPGAGLKEWLKLPRKKVPDSPTLVLKKAIVVQILSADNTVADQRILYFDK